MSYTIEELEKQIKYNNYLYWNNLPLKISDIEYDNLVRELTKLDPNNPLVTNFAKPQLNGNEKLIKHSKPMLSLDKLYSKEDLIKWIKKVSRNNSEKFLIQPKYDGMSGLLENGTLSSRGTGEYGQDYTDKLKIIEFDSKKNIDVNTSTLLGEIIIKNSTFKDVFPNIKSKTGIPFKNQRNGIAGILGTDDTDFYYNQGVKITFVDYDLNSWETTCETFEKDWDKIVNDILTNIDYPLDGIVIKLADEKYSDSLGYTTHHPKGQVAFKFTNQKAESKLIGIEWGMGKQQISAIGLIEPVEISGITIKRVKLQLTKPKSSAVETCLIDGSLQIGDTVVVERAGDIIPHIISSKPGQNRQRVVIDKCPFCGSNLIINDSSVQCSKSNGHCFESEIQELYCSIVTLGIKNVGEAYIRNIVTDPYINVRYIADLFELKPNDLKAKEHGTRKKEIFFEEIEKVKQNTTKELVFASLNLPNIGKSISKLLVKNFDWEQLITGKYTEAEFLAIPGIGPESANTLVNYLQNENWVSDNLIRMTNICHFKEDEVVNANAQTICFTGKMEHKRSEMEEIAKKKGYIPIDHVDKTLNILVCADPNSGSSKLQKAAKLGIKVISEKEFMDEY